MKELNHWWLNWNCSLSAARGCIAKRTTTMHVSYGLNTLATSSNLTRLHRMGAQDVTLTREFIKTFIGYGKHTNI